MNSSRLLVIFFILLFVGSNSFIQLCLAKNDMNHDIQERMEQIANSVATPENQEKMSGWLKKHGQAWQLFLATERNLSPKDMQLVLKVLALKDFQQSMIMAELQKKELELSMKEASIARNTELERYFRACSDQLKDPKNKAFEHFKNADCSKIFKQYAELMSDYNTLYEEAKKQEAQFKEQMLKQQKKEKRYADSIEEDEE